MPIPSEAELETFDYTDFGVGTRYLAQKLVDDDWIPVPARRCPSRSWSVKSRI